MKSPIIVFVAICGSFAAVSCAQDTKKNGTPESWRLSPETNAYLPSAQILTDDKTIDLSSKESSGLVFQLRLRPVLGPIPAKYVVDMQGFMCDSALLEITVRNVGQRNIVVPTRMPTGLPLVGWKDDGTLKVFYEFFPAVDYLSKETVIQLPEMDYGPVTLAPGESTKLTPIMIPHAALTGKRVILVGIAVEESLQKKTGWPLPVELRLDDSKVLKAIQEDSKKYP